MKYFNNNLFNKLFFFVFLISIFFLNQKTINAQTSDGNFPVGAFMGSDPTEAVKLSYDSSGMNTIVWKANSSNHTYLQKYDVMAFNINSTDWINHYSTGCYSKWESEENQTDTLKIGVKHIRRDGQFIGSEANWGGVQCWSTLGLNGPADSLIYGPHYFQAKKYRRVYGDTLINFIARFNLALDYNPQLVNPTDPVCKITVVYRYNDINDNSKKYLDTLLEKTLTVSDFPIPDSFKVFDFDGLTYQYNTNIFPSEILGRNSPDPSQINYTDWVSGTGIQFCVDWLGDSDLGNLYVDYAEVYDANGWNDYIDDSTDVQIKINTYLSNYSSTEWPNIKYWYAHDEPHSIDAFIPIRKVDEILRNAGSAPLITHFFEVNVYKNGEYIYEHFYNAVQPEKLMFDAYPFHTNPLVGHDFESLPTKLQQSHELQPGFYYVPQAFGLIYSSGQGWYKPSSEELNASVMLALAYGSKGIMFSDYYSYQSDYGFVDAIVDGQGNKSYLWDHIHDNLVSRLIGNFGNLLLDLNYTGNYLQLQHFTPTQNPLPQPPTYDYLTIGLQASNHDMNWHVGFLKEKEAAKCDNNYFLMANLWTNSEKTIQVKVTPPIDAQGYSNYRFRNIEPENNFDITFNVQASSTLNFPAGEGYLFQVAPVVKYGGKLVYSEIVGDGMTLTGDMSIENGATLSVYETYYAKANIIVKAGGRIDNYENGKIIFDPGKQLIIEGTAQINGTALNRLTLEFSTETLEGIVVKPNAALYLNYCDVKNVKTAISAEPGSGQINISNVNFTNFSKAGVLLLGYQGDGPITPPPPTISNCNFFGSPVGVSVSNYNEILIQANTFNNCNITIASVTSAYLQGNSLNGGSSKIFAGIFMDNSGGYIRCNSITNFLSGAHLGNSSPDIGDNTIHHNIYHGLYIGSGSIPNLFARLISGQPYTYYGASGYNRIYENGMGYDPNNLLDNDGSEIYFSLSSALLGTVKRPGCNLIADDRQSTPTMSTLLLMNGTLNGDQQLYAQNNVWGTTTPTTNRFGNLSVVFSPYYSEPCLLPEGSGGSTELVTKTSTGIVVDTLYPAEGLPEDVSTLEASYSLADKHILLGEVEQAKPIYEQIVQGNYTSEEKLPAYNKLYTIANLTGADETYFNNLQNTFNDIASIETDSLLKKIYNQNAIKCDVSKQEYLTAISKFDNIIQQNPNSEEAVYAEIDIITTALNLDTTNSQLGKMGGGKYLVKGTSDYLTKLNNILQNKFGINSEEKEQIIPKEYSLYQNYPNPFNPTTTIRYALPQDGIVTIKIFDILGQQVATLKNEFQKANRYEVKFDSKGLASGVYIYKIQVNNFIESKKMILLK